MELFAPKLILVPTDFSETAAHALRYASTLAQRFGAHLLVLHVGQYTPPVDFMTVAAGVCDYSRQPLLEQSLEFLQRNAEENIATAVPFDIRVVEGATVPAIAAQVRECGADLIVMGTHGRMGLSRLLFGSVTAAVMQTATVPVIAVNADVSEMAHVAKILCPVTFTDATREALRHAAALVESRSAPLVLIRKLDKENSRNELRELVHLRRWVPRELVDRCEMQFCTDESATEITSVASKTHVDLIAVGVEPETTVYDTLRGTVAEQIVQRSRCAVLTMNAKAAAGRSAVSELAGTTSV
jgi:nucleotide-binding universal stress UspA family protein